MRNSELKKLNLILCGTITRALRGLRGLKGRAYVVGGLITEGATLRDIDIIVTELSDIKKLQKALGRFSKRAHFMLQKTEPSAPIFLTLTGKEPKSIIHTESGGKKISKFTYAEPIK